MPNHLDNWAKHTKIPRRTNKAPEKAIQKAIQEAFRLKHQIVLHETNAGGMSDKKGVIRCPKDIALALGMPWPLPFGVETWLGLPPGFSDLLGRENGSQRLIFIECKAPGGRFRPGQKEFLEARRAEGHVAFWASSVDEAIAQFAHQSGLAA